MPYHILDFIEFYKFTKENGYKSIVYRYKYIENYQKYNIMIKLLDYNQRKIV